MFQPIPNQNCDSSSYDARDDRATRILLPIVTGETQASSFAGGTSFNQPSDGVTSLQHHLHPTHNKHLHHLQLPSITDLWSGDFRSLAQYGTASTDQQTLQTSSSESLFGNQRTFFSQSMASDSSRIPQHNNYSGSYYEYDTFSHPQDPSHLHPEYDYHPPSHHLSAFNSSSRTHHPSRPSVLPLSTESMNRHESSDQILAYMTDAPDSQSSNFARTPPAPRTQAPFPSTPQLPLASPTAPGFVRCKIEQCKMQFRSLEEMEAHCAKARARLNMKVQANPTLFWRCWEMRDEEARREGRTLDMERFKEEMEVHYRLH